MNALKTKCAYTINYLKRLTFIVIAYLILLALSSCNMHQGKDSVLKIGINEWAGYNPFIIADQAEIFTENGLNADIVRYASATEEMEALRLGKIQGAALTLDEVVKLVASGFPVKVILVIDYSMGGDMILGQVGLTEISQLEGKKVGFEGSVVGEFLLHRALRSNGIFSSSMELINIPANEWKEAFKSKRVDALVCYNPVASTLIEKEMANVLFSSADIPFQIIDVLVFSESFYGRNKEILAKVVQTWFDAIEFQNKNPEEAMKIIMKIKNIDSIDYKFSQDGLVIPDLATNNLIFNPESERNIFKYSQTIINFMFSQGLINERINTTELFVKDILDATNYNITTKQLHR